jgi:hypothetical protein
MDLCTANDNQVQQHWIYALLMEIGEQVAPDMANAPHG